jgi:hypothetical protein
MKVTKTRRLKLLKDMEASKEIHNRGHYTVSEREILNMFEVPAKSPEPEFLVKVALLEGQG